LCHTSPIAFGTHLVANILEIVTISPVHGTEGQESD